MRLLKERLSREIAGEVSLAPVERVEGGRHAMPDAAPEEPTATETEGFEFTEEDPKLTETPGVLENGSGFEREDPK